MSGNGWLVLGSYHTAKRANRVARHTYANNNPFKFTDPDGRYARGSGFTNKEWNRFNRAQRRSAKSMDNAARKISRALETGKRIKRVTKAFERVFGKGNGTAENMTAVASSLTSMADVLKDDGTNGFTASGQSQSDMTALLGRDATDVLAAGEVGGNNIYVNTGHASFTDSAELGRSTGHESAHNVGMRDQRVNGVTAYKYGTDAQRAAFGSLPTIDPAAALVNPDTVMDFTQ